MDFPHRGKAHFLAVITLGLSRLGTRCPGRDGPARALSTCCCMDTQRVAKML